MTTHKFINNIEPIMVKHSDLDSLYNIVKQPILKYLIKHKSTDEFKLLKFLNFTGFEEFSISNRNSNIIVFQTHFLLFHVIYRLNLEGKTTKQPFYINTLITKIEFNWLSCHSTSSTKVTELKFDQKLADYYLDYRNITKVSEVEADKMISEFYEKYIRWHKDQIELDFGRLELKPEASRQVIDYRYKQLRSKHHPDKGGDKTIFTEVQDAYTRIITLKDNGII